MVNAVSMDNVEHAYAVQQLRKSGKIAKIVSVFTKSFRKLLSILWTIIESKAKVKNYSVLCVSIYDI